MRIRPQQLAALREQGIEGAHRTRLERLRTEGYEVEGGARPGELVVHDAAGGAARVELRGRFTRTTTAEGRVIETEQYLNGRIRSLRDPLGREIVFDRDADGFLTAIDRGPSGGRFGFDLTPDWKPRRVDYPDGTSARAEYDDAGRPVRLTDRAGHAVRYERTAAGELTGIVDPRGARTAIEYRGWSWPSAVVHADGTRHEYEYDGDGRLERFRVAGREHGRFHVDAETGVHEARYHDGSWARLRVEHGRITAAENEHGTVELVHDEAGRLLSESFAGNRVTYERNAVGALLALVTPTGERVVYERDRDGRLVAVRDGAGARYEIEWGPAGPPRRIRYANGTAVEQSVDELGRVASWTLRAAGGRGRDADTARFSYDVCDRLVGVSRAEERRAIQYDRAGRVTGVESSDPAFTERFELDANGNRVRDGAGPSEFDACNRVRRRGAEPFDHDALGNLAGLGGWSLRYDARGHLIEASRAGTTVRCAYDALGRRIRKQVGDRVTHYRWAGAQLLSETVIDGGGTVDRRDYLVCPEFPTPLAMRRGGAVYCLHAGRRHEVLAMTDKAGAVVWKADYLAFGPAIVEVAEVEQPWRLAGQYADAETGLHYVGARYFSPDLGRFLTPDPFGPEGGSLNLYLLGDGDPMNRIDPTGEISLTLATVLVAMAIGAAVGAAIGAGIELYRQRNEPETDWGQVGRAALIGGCIGAIGAAVGAIATAAAATIVGGLAAGAIGGGLAAGVEYCVEAVGTGEFSWGMLGVSVLAGATAGAVTAGIGGVVAGRAARKAEEAAARKLAQEAEEAAARKLAQEAEEAAARKLAQEAEDAAARKLAQEAEERAAREAAKAATRDPTELGKAIGAGVKSQPKGKTDAILKQVAELPLSPEDKAKALDAACKEAFGMSAGYVKVGDDFVVLPNMPPGNRPIVGVRPDGSTYSGTADLVIDKTTTPWRVTAENVKPKP
jgi:RHS repeat-associated protein